MKWSILFDTAVKRENFDDLSKILMSRLVRKTQKKSFIFTPENDYFTRTQYNFCIDTSELSRNIMNRIIAYSSETLKNESDFLGKINAGDIAASSSLIAACGLPPFGVIGEYAIRRWFSSGLKKIYFKDKPVLSHMNEHMKDDFIHYSSIAHTYRYIKRYNDSDLLFPDYILAPVSEIRSDKSIPGCCYSEIDIMEKISQELKIKYHHHPLSYIVNAAFYIVSVTSFFEDAVYYKLITCRDMINVLRCTENFYEDTENDEYEEFASSVKYFEEVATGHVFSKDIDDPDAIRKWLIYVKSVMCDMVAKSFVKNYREIMTGKYADDLISDSWCRTFRLGFDNVEKKITELSGRLHMMNVKVIKVYNYLLESFVKAVIYYDTEEKMDDDSMMLIDVIHHKYKKVYKETSCDKDENEKLYLRIMMVLDYLTDLTDKEITELADILRGYSI